MEIKVSKNELAGALSALGKPVCRTSPVEAFRSVQIKGKENKIMLKTANTEESIKFSVDAELTEPYKVDMFKIMDKAPLDKETIAQQVKELKKAQEKG